MRARLAAPCRATLNCSYLYTSKISARVWRGSMHICMDLPTPHAGGVAARGAFPALLHACLSCLFDRLTHACMHALTRTFYPVCPSPMHSHPSSSHAAVARLLCAAMILCLLLLLLRSSILLNLYFSLSLRPRNCCSICFRATSPCNCVHLQPVCSRFAYSQDFVFVCGGAAV